MKKLSIIIVSYNTRQMTLECLESVYDQTKMDDFEVIVLDNDSSDGSAEAIAENYPQARLIQSKDNLGFAMGNNKAIESAEGEYILLLNPDTVVLDNAIDRLMAFAESNPSAGIWGGKTLFGDKSLNPNSCFRQMSLWNQFCRASGLAGVFKHSPIFHSEHYGGWPRDSIRHVDIVCGCFLLIKLELWKQLGGFDRRFFMYAEESDLCLRAKTQGYDPMITPDAVIVHYGGGSEKVRADKMVRLLSAKVELQKAHWPSWKFQAGRALFKLWALNRSTLYWLAMTTVPGGKSRYQESFKAWSNVWQRRRDWSNGYTK